MKIQILVYITTLKKQNSVMGETRDVAKGQITFLKIILKTMQNPPAYPKHDPERKQAT